MALIVADRVMEASTTTGTGNFALGGAYTGYRAFDDVMANADTCYYTIEAIDANGNPSGAWETGLGTFNDTDTLVRTSVSASSNAGAAVDFAAGNKRVMLDVTATHIATFYRSGGTDVALADGGTGASLVDPNADRLLLWDDSAGAMVWCDLHANLEISGTTLKPKPRGALVRKASDQTTADYTGTTAIGWDTELRDTDGIHDNVTNNTRLTVPTGVTKVRLSGQVRATSHTADTHASLFLSKGGSITFNGMFWQSSEIGATAANLNARSAILDVSATEYFELILQVESDASITIEAARSWFEMEIIE